MIKRKYIVVLICFFCSCNLMFAQNAPCPWAILCGINFDNVKYDGKEHGKQWHEHIYELLLEQVLKTPDDMAFKYHANPLAHSYVSKCYKRDFYDYRYNSVSSWDIRDFNQDPNRAFILFVNIKEVRSRRIALGEEYKGKVVYLPFYEVVIEGDVTLYGLNKQSQNTNDQEIDIFIGSLYDNVVVGRIPFKYTYVPGTPTEEDSKNPNWWAAYKSLAESNIISNYAKELLRIRGEILQISKFDKSGQKAQEVYIDLGFLCKLEKGDVFDVYINGNQIGKITISEVISDNRSLCKVRSGNDSICQALNNGEKVIIKKTI